MNLRIAVVAVFLTSVGGRSALAHENHQHPAPVAEIGEEGAKARAVEEVVRLVSIKKVDSSWKEASVKAVEKKTYEGRWEWLATLENKKAKEKVLYVFLKPSGEFIAANFTGK